MKEHEYQFRIFPEQFVDPIDFASYFDDPSKPLEIDLGCGKGRFLVQHSFDNPEINFLGIDRMLGRIRKLDGKLIRKGVRNARIFRLEGDYTINFLVPAESVDTYYYFFPDPWPKARHHENRLFKERAVNAIHKTLKVGGVLHIATDHEEYFEEMNELMKADPRFEVAPIFYPNESEMSDFELRFKGTRQTNRCSFRKI